MSSRLRHRVGPRGAGPASLGRAWVVVLALLASVLGQAWIQAAHEHTAGPATLGCAAECVGPAGAEGEPPKPARDHDKRGCGLCEKHTLAKLGMAPGLTGPAWIAAGMVEVEGAWTRVERPTSRGAGTARARGPPSVG